MEADVRDLGSTTFAHLVLSTFVPVKALIRFPENFSDDHSITRKIGMLPLFGTALTKDNAPVIAAFMAATAALVGVVVNAIITWKMSNRQKALEGFKAELQAILSNRQALTAYKFDARRRLYEECEPIFFQIREASHDALRLIPRFCQKEFQEALSANRENVGPGGYWMLSKSSTIIYSLYCLLRPLALFCLLKRKMTDVDLSLDAGVLFRYRLARELYACLHNDDEIARLSPRVQYNPLVSDWRELRKRQPAKHWWQGATPGRLENGVACLIDHDRVISFGEFEEVYLKAYEERGSGNQKRLGVVANALYDFRPEDRPVFWRILIIKAHIYAALVKPVPEDIPAISRLPDQLRVFLELPEELAKCIDPVVQNTTTDPPLAGSDLGLDYLVGRLFARPWA